MAEGPRSLGRRHRAGRPQAHDSDRRPGRGRRDGDPAAARHRRRAPRADRRAQGGREIAPLDFYFLTDGGQTADAVAERLALFLDGATTSMDIAIYDLRLDASPAAAVLASFEAAVKRGVKIRLMFNQDHALAIPVPAPPEIDWDFVHRLEAAGVQVKPVSGVPDLMHHKYVVRDATTDAATVWTGSTNWTNDSWTREENVILKIPSPALAAEYARNFAELWDAGRVEGSGKYDLAGVPIDYQGSPVKAHVFFAPGRGRQMAHVIAQGIAHA